MGDMGEVFKDMKEDSKKRRAGHREESPKFLQKAGIPFKSKNMGAHLIDDLDRPLIESASNAYGYCPICGSTGVSRERRMNGDDRCSEGHNYPSFKSKKML